MKPSLRGNFAKKKTKMDDWLNNELTNIGQKPVVAPKEVKDEQPQLQETEKIIERNKQKGFNLFKNTQSKFTINKDKLEAPKEEKEKESQPQMFKRPFDGTRGKFFKKPEEDGGPSQESIVTKMTQGNNEGGEIRTDKQVIVRPFSSKRGGNLINQIKKQEGSGLPTGAVPSNLKEKLKHFQPKGALKTSVDRSKEVKVAPPKQEQADDYGDDFDDYSDDNNNKTQAEFKLFAKKEKHVNQQREINLEVTEKSVVSEEKIEKQRQRVADLHDMVCLETETFECIFEMLPKKQYSRYVERLSDKRSREIKVQTGEETEEKGMQSTPIETKCYQNQCPEDRSKYNLLSDEKASGVQQVDLRFSKYLEFIQPVIEGSIAHAGQSTRSISTKYSFQAAWLEMGGLLEEAGMRVVDVYVPSVNGQVYKYVLLRAMEGDLVLEFMHRKVTKTFFSGVPVCCMTKTGCWLVAGGQGGQVMVYNLNESETYHRGQRKGRQHQSLQEVVEKEGLPVVRKASFCSDYLQEEESDILAREEEGVPSRVVGMVGLDRNRLVVAQQLGQVVIYEVESLTDEQQQRQYVEMGIQSKVRLKLVRRVQLKDALEGVLSQDAQGVYLRSAQGLVRLEFSSEETVVYNNWEEAGVLRKSVMHPSCHDQVYVASPQEPDSLLVYSRKYSSLLKRIPLICPMKSLIKIQSLFLELKVKETQKRLKVDDQGKIMLLDSTGQLVVYCLLQEQVVAHMDFQKELAVELGKKQLHFRQIFASDLDMNYTMRVVFHLTSKQVIDCHVNMIKFIERDYRLIKKRNLDLQTKFYQLL